MKTLYITDLDGTLLNSESKLSDYTKNTLNKLIENDVLFSVSTARSAATIGDVIGELNINIPISCMNGSVIYNLKEKKFVKVFLIETNSLKSLFKIFEENSFHCFLFSENNNVMTCHYTPINNPNSQKFYDERKTSDDKYFKLSQDYESLLSTQIFFIAMLNTLEYVQNVYNKIKDVAGINISYYKDHNKNDLYFLEICSNICDKGRSAEFIKHCVNADRIVSFGDNLNDIPLFEASDECYAVSNSHKRLKKLATDIADSNDNDGVIKKILELNSTDF